MSQRIILASGSEQRKNLFTALNIPFKIIRSDIDEQAIQDPDLKKRAELVARGKAEKVMQTEQGIIIAADTYPVYQNKALEKPQDIQEAITMLRQISNNTIMVYTGFCYIDRLHNIDYSTTTETQCTLRELTEEEIQAYAAAFPVTTWSAAFSAAYPYGMTLIAHINGSFTGLNGLPMEVLVPLLRQSGVEVKP